MFTCITIRAVYIEMVPSHDTLSGVMALEMFFARRGTPTTINSDSGTNFVGAQKELKARSRCFCPDRVQVENPVRCANSSMVHRIVMALPRTSLYWLARISLKISILYFQNSFSIKTPFRLYSRDVFRVWSP